MDFSALVEPVLLYGSDCLGHSNISKVESFYNGYFKRCLGLKTGTAMNMLCIELGISSY